MGLVLPVNLIFFQSSIAIQISIFQFLNLAVDMRFETTLWWVKQTTSAGWTLPVDCWFVTPGPVFTILSFCYLLWNSTCERWLKTSTLLSEAEEEELQ